MTLNDIFSQRQPKHHIRNLPGERHLVRVDGAWTLRVVPPRRVRVVLNERRPQPVVVSGAGLAAEVLPTQPFGAVKAVAA